MDFSNREVANILRGVAAAYTIKKAGNIFQIRAYETAADSVENSTANIADLWQEGRLEQVPALGEKIQSYLDELFRTGKVRHFQEVERGIPKVVFELLNIPGVGPKTAQKIAELGVDSLEELEKQLKSGKLVEKGFSSKLAEKILSAVAEISQRTNRMLLPYASAQAEAILQYLRGFSKVSDVNPLGSLRRRLATVGDLDFAASSDSPKEVVDFFVKMPQVSQIFDQGENKATVVLKGGVQADLLVGKPNTYGALLQHFTGSKNHNIHLRTIAEKRGLSISEYGVKEIKSGKVIPCKTEKELYDLLNMQTPPPEIREDMGEIEAAMKHQLPDLVELKNIKGDLHTHSNYPFSHPSHGPGVNIIEEMVKKAQDLGYQFIGISDHAPGYTSVSREEMVRAIEKRTKFIQQLKKKTKSIRVLNGLEIDILGNGDLSVPDEALVTLDFCIAGIHSGHRGSKGSITQRLLKALANPNVDIISHPTNRLLNERESSEADWDKIFEFCAKYNKLLEINAYPNRLDLRDDLVRKALQFKVKFVIDTDAHEASQMENMEFGVSVARRGWATAKDVVNAWDWKKFADWFNI